MYHGKSCPSLGLKERLCVCVVTAATQICLYLKQLLEMYVEVPFVSPEADYEIVNGIGKMADHRALKLQG